MGALSNVKEFFENWKNQTVVNFGESDDVQEDGSDCEQTFLCSIMTQLPMCCYDSVPSREIAASDRASTSTTSFSALSAIGVLVLVFSCCTHVNSPESSNWSCHA